MNCNKLASTEGLERNAWLQLRKQGVGGSEAAALAGVSKYGNALSVYLDKTGKGKEVEENEAMAWGNILEDVVAQEFAKRSGCEVSVVPFILQHVDHPFMLANLDRLCLDNGVEGILECKTCGPYTANEWDDGAYPQAYELQCRHYMAVTQLPYAYLVCLVAGQRLEIRKIERDLELEAHLIRIESDFWQMVIAKEMPAIDGTDVSSELLAAMYEKSVPERIVLPRTAVTFIGQHKTAHADEKAAKQRKDEAANSLKALMGLNEQAVCGDWHLRWVPVTTNRLDMDALKEEMPAVYEGFLKESISRKFTIGVLKKEKA